MAGEDYYGGGSPVIRFTFTVDGIDTVAKGLGAWGAAVSDLSPVLEEIGDDMRADFAANYVSEGAIFNAERIYYGGRVINTGSSGRWDDLRPSTKADRARKGYPPEHPILYRDGTLMNSLTMRGALGNISQVDKTHAVFGTASPIAQFHQFGTSKMAQRRLVNMTKERREAIIKKVGDYVRRAARAAGLNARG